MVRMAYSTLTDAEKRAHYDAHGWSPQPAHGLGAAEGALNHHLAAAIISSSVPTKNASRPAAKSAATRPTVDVMLTCTLGHSLDS